jgi:CrcB protein
VSLAFVVGVAGSLGAVARYLVDAAVRSRLGPAFPIGTWIVNLVGSFVLGVVASGRFASLDGGNLRTIVGTGACGGLTTWSAASWETVRLLEGAQWRAAALNGLGGLAASCGAAAAGILLGLAL